MNILHVSTYLQGGAGRVIQDLALEQNRNGHIVTVAINDEEYPGYFNYSEYLEALNHNGIEIVRADGLFKRDVYRNINGAQNIQSILNNHNIDIIHSHAAVPSLAALLGRNNIRRHTPERNCTECHISGCKKTGHHIPVIQTMHGWGINKNSEQGSMDIGILNMVDRVVAVSNSARELLISKGVNGDNVSVVYNGVRDCANAIVSSDVNVVDDVSQSSVVNDNDNEKERVINIINGAEIEAITNTKRDKIRIICIGTVCQRKNQELILKALHRLDDIAQFVFIGEDDEGIIKSSDAKSIIHYGYLPNANNYIPNFDYLILPSRSEGLGLVVLESYMYSTPVIVSDLPVFKEYFTDGKHGFLFDDNSEDSLVSTIQVAYDTKRNHSQKYDSMKKACRFEYENRFCLDIMLKNYETLYKEIMT